jgi:hypothetical protein
LLLLLLLLVGRRLQAEDLPQTPSNVPPVLLVVKPNSQRLSVAFGRQALGSVKQVGGHVFEGEAARKVLFEVVGVDPVEDYEAEAHAIAAFDDEEGAFDLCGVWGGWKKGRGGRD